jgi:transposase
MKDGCTHLAHAAEQAVDLETGAIVAVAVAVQDADVGDTTTLVGTLTRAADHLARVAPTGLAEVVADKGYHSSQTLVELAEAGVRSYVSEPDRRRRH